MEARCLIVVSRRTNTDTDLYWAPAHLITEDVLGALSKYDNASELVDAIGNTDYGLIDGPTLHELCDNMHELESLYHGDVLDLKDYQRMIYLPGDS